MPAPARARAILFRLVLIVGSVVVTLAAGELLMRTWLMVRYGAPMLGLPSDAGLVLDPRLGWRANENFQFHGARLTSGGRPYRVDASLARDGFRMYGNPDAPEPRILVLGDSYTEAVEVSNGRTYFAVMGNRLHAQVFAYGAGGYGTLQELMILGRWLDRIRPDLVVWQFMSNDYINNSEELERESRINNNGAVRPYLIDGRIEYRMPSAHPLLRGLLARFRLGEFVLARVDRFMAQLPTVEREIESQGFQHPGFRRSVAVTGALFGRLKQRAGKVPVVLFSADDEQPYFDATRRLAAAHGLAFVEEVQQAIRAAEARHADVRSADHYHWNEEGHRLAGEALSDYLAQNFGDRLRMRQIPVEPVVRK